MISEGCHSLALMISKACHSLALVINLPIVGKTKLVAIILVGLVIIAGITFVIIGLLTPQKAGIQIETSPSSLVFIDGEQVGRTPHEELRKPGEVTIKLIPESFDRPLMPYETKANLVSGVKTIVTHEFSQTEADSAGEIITFEKIARGESGLAVISTPEAAQVFIDGQPRGYTPYKTSSLPPGEHKLSISAEGYSDRAFNIKTYSGYGLTANVKLMPVSEEVLAESHKEEKITKTIVTIEETPTGFLRVRSEPSTLSKEIGQVEPGDKYDLLAEDDSTGWFKIEIDENKIGWVSSQYALKEDVEISADKLEENESTKSATPTSIKP